MAIKLAFIGCGGMGRSHLRRLFAMDRVEIVGIVDNAQESLRKARETVEEVAPGKLGQIAFDSDAMRLIRQTDADAVVIPLPSGLHAEYAIAALEAGKHVFCEKPMALRVEDAQAMMDARDRSGKVLMIGHSVRFGDVYRRLKQMTDQSEYGRVIRAHFYRIGGMWGHENAAQIWFLDQNASGGSIMDLHIHDADYIVSLLGRPAAVEAVGVENQILKNSGPDQMCIRYVYNESLPFVTAETGWLRIPGARFDAGFEVDFEGAILRFSHWDKQCRLYTPNQQTPRCLCAPDAPRQAVENVQDVPAEPSMWDHFLDSVQEGRPPTLCPAEDALFAVKMVEGAVQAMRSGRRVNLDGAIAGEDQPVGEKLA